MYSIISCQLCFISDEDTLCKHFTVLQIFLEFWLMCWKFHALTHYITPWYKDWNLDTIYKEILHLSHCHLSFFHFRDQIQGKISELQPSPGKQNCMYINKMLIWPMFGCVQGGKNNRSVQNFQYSLCAYNV
jgi:hypothetical protein